MGMCSPRMAATFREYSVVFEYIAQFLFQLTLGEDILDAAPSGFPPLRGCRRLGPALGALNQGIEIMRFFGFAKKLIIDIEMFVVSFTHFSRKALEINGIDQPGA